MCLYTKVGRLIGATPLPATKVPVTIRTRSGEYEQSMPFGTMASSCDDGGVPVEIIDEAGNAVGVSSSELGGFHTGMKIIISLDALSSLIH